jgi:hypothetical protein
MVKLALVRESRYVYATVSPWDCRLTCEDVKKQRIFHDEQLMLRSEAAMNNEQILVFMDAAPYSL